MVGVMVKSTLQVQIIETSEIKWCQINTSKIIEQVGTLALPSPHGNFNLNERKYFIYISSLNTQITCINDVLTVLLKRHFSKIVFHLNFAILLWEGNINALNIIISSMALQ